MCKLAYFHHHYHPQHPHRPCHHSDDYKNILLWEFLYFGPVSDQCTAAGVEIKSCVFSIRAIIGEKVRSMNRPLGGQLFNIRRLLLTIIIIMIINSSSIITIITNKDEVISTEE